MEWENGNLIQFSLLDEELSTRLHYTFKGKEHSHKWVVVNKASFLATFDAHVLRAYVKKIEVLLL
jgi:hypothetical protein